MINIERPAQPPASLQLPKVQDYLERLAKYKQDPRQDTKPNKPSEYRTSDILTAFEIHFLKKCYLTERKFESAYEMDVEHFAPFSEKPELVFEWTNLFPSDHKANMIKPRKTPDGGYLDPCKPSDDVENDILYALSTYGKKPNFKARDQANVKAVNTARLLDLLHNGENERSRENTKYLRRLIQKQFIKTHKAIIEWLNAEDDQERFQAETKLRKLVSRRASFTALIRSIPAVRQNVPKDFLD